MTTNFSVLDFLRRLPASVLELDEKPLCGYAPSFPWGELSEKIGQALQVKDLQVELVGIEWRTAEQILSGMDSQPSILHFSVAPLEGNAGWVMPKNAIKTLLRLLIGKTGSSFEHIDVDFLGGFYIFIAGQVAQILPRVDFDRELSVVLLEQQDAGLPETALCLDIAIKLHGTTVTGCLVIPPAMRSSWKLRNHDSSRILSAHSPLLDKIVLTMNIELGSSELNKKEWSALQPGDFILLDQCSYDPDSDKGRVKLSLNGSPLYRARLKNGKLKILESPLLNEVGSDMNTIFENFDPFSDEHEESADSLHTEEEEFEHEADSEMETETEHSEHSLSEGSIPQKTRLDPAELPITVVVEAGRLQTNVQQLMDLQPGNVFELDMHIENGVDLVVNGRRVGRGELLKINDALGVRILSLG